MLFEIMTPEQTKPNIIFIVMDALRAKNLGCYGYSRKTSPNIDFLSKNGTMFTNAFTSNNATYKAYLSILAGRHVLLENSKELFFTKQEINSFFSSGGTFLQEILKKQDYKTYCLKYLNGWQKQGFDFYYKEASQKTSNNFINKLKQNSIARIMKLLIHLGPKSIADYLRARYGRNSDEKVTKDAIEIIEKSKPDEKFFLWVDFDYTHIPYNPRKFTNKFTGKGDEEFFKKIKGKPYNTLMKSFWKNAFNNNETIEDIIARYDSAIAFDDSLIGDILQTLKKKKLLDNTLIFFFSDHGESLDEHGIYFSHHGLYDVATQVPLIMYGKSIPKDKKITSLVQHEDLVPTILDLLGIKYSPLEFDGKSLIQLIKNKSTSTRELIFMEEGDYLKKQGIRTKNLKYLESSSIKDATCKICNNTHGGLIELYDLKKDPKEEQNLAKSDKQTLIKMKLKLESAVRDLKLTNEKRRIRHLISKKAKYL